MTVRLFVYGIVQGVGFRPFVMALAQEWNLRGTVCNTGSSVCIDLEGEESAISGFRKDLMMKAPKGLPNSWNSRDVRDRYGKEGLLYSSQSSCGG